MEAAKGDARTMKFLQNVEQECATSLYAAVSKDLEGKGGLYLEGASLSGPAPADGDNIEYGHAEWAFDREKEEKLWEVSKKLVGVE